MASSGTTALRPLEPLVGQQFFDTDLTPPRVIVWNGTAWVNVDGTAI